MNGESIPRQYIVAIWQAFALGKVRTIAVPRRGCSNACLLINEDRVVRFQVTELPRHKFRTEKIAYDLLRASDLPVPQVIVLDESQTLAPYSYLVTTQLPGETVYDSWEGLDDPARTQLAFDAGRCLALLHRHRLPVFGDLSQREEDSFPTWRAYLENEVTRHSRRAREEELLDQDTTRRIERLLVRFQPLLDAVRTGCLLHRDYHFENLLQQDGKITGMIDFEWAMAGDPSFDCRLDEALEECPGSVAPFYEGYASISPLSQHHRVKADFYRLLLCLESIAGWGLDPEAADWMPGEYRRLFVLLPALERAV